MLQVKTEFWLKFFNLETTQAGKFYPEYNYAHVQPYKHV